jgi:hypothetical protein
MPMLRTRLLWRGTDRARLNKLKNALTMLIRRDDAAARNTPIPQVLPFFFAEDAEPAIRAAMDLLLARVATLKSART